MRFKARTNLERVFDEINKNSFGRVNNSIIKKQLTELGLFESEEGCKIDSDLPDFYTSKIQKEKNKNVKALRKIYEVKIDNLFDNEKTSDINSPLNNKTSNSFFKKRKIVDNSGAKNFMMEYHNKTHFKAITNFALFNSKLKFVKKVSDYQKNRARPLS